LLDRLGVAALTALYFAAAVIDAVRRAWSSRAHTISIEKEPAR
jgi:hypothetical protein